MPKAYRYLVLQQIRDVQGTSERTQDVAPVVLLTSLAWALISASPCFSFTAYSEVVPSHCFRALHRVGGQYIQVLRTLAFFATLTVFRNAVASHYGQMHAVRTPFSFSLLLPHMLIEHQFNVLLFTLYLNMCEYSYSHSTMKRIQQSCSHNTVSTQHLYTATLTKYAMPRANCYSNMHQSNTVSGLSAIEWIPPCLYGT
jgi:hypothetical protein